mmetsp:Transcript_4955/g.20410  ORF Transcript_4955/g.20410 Transcript_4955/m.20410 type:complete len:247 (+) Transcript_4955:40-780(+)
MVLIPIYFRGPQRQDAPASPFVAVALPALAVLVLGHLPLPLELHRRRPDPVPVAEPVDDVHDLPGHDHGDAVADAHGFRVGSHGVLGQPLHDRVERVIAVPVLVVLVAAPSPVPLRELRAELAHGQTAPSPAGVRAVHHVRRERRRRERRGLSLSSTRGGGAVPAPGRLVNRAIGGGGGRRRAREREPARQALGEPPRRVSSRGAHRQISPRLLGFQPLQVRRPRGARLSRRAGRRARPIVACRRA